MKKELAKLCCCVTGLLTFTLVVFLVFGFHKFLEYMDTYDKFLENSQSFVTILSFIHNGFILVYAISIMANILMDVNKNENS